MSAHDTHEHTARNCLWCKDIVYILEIAFLRYLPTNNLSYTTEASGQSDMQIHQANAKQVSLLYFCDLHIRLIKNTQQINAARAIVYKSP